MKEKLCVGPLKWLFTSLAIHLWQRAKLQLFTTGCYLCTFWALVLQGGDPSLRIRPHSSEGDPIVCLIILAVGAQPAL